MRPLDSFPANRFGAYTKGENEVGQKYTAFSADASIDDLRKLIEKDSSSAAQALLLAKNIEWAKFVTHNENLVKSENYSVEIKWDQKQAPQRFQGKRRLENGRVISTLTPADNSDGLTLDLSCSQIGDFECGKAVTVLKSGPKIVGGIEFVRQQKVMRTLPSSTFTSNALSPKAKTYFDNHEKGEPIIARSFSVVYGNSSVDYLQNTSTGLRPILSTELLDPDGEALPVRWAAPELEQLGRTKVVGNNTNGSLYLLQEDKESKKEFVTVIDDGDVARDNTPAVSNAVPAVAEGNGECTIADKRPAVPLAKTMVEEIVDSCDKGRMSDMRNFWKVESPNTVKRLIETYSEAQSAPKSDIAKRMKIALAEIKAEHFADAILGITLVESNGYNPFAVSNKGAKSEWQLMPCTAFEMGILRLRPGGKCTNNKDIVYDGRLDSRAATRAMLKYIKLIFDHWQYTDPTTGEKVLNLPMTYASYMAGPYGTKNRIEDVAENLKKGKNGKILSLGKLTDSQIRLISSDFFFLAKNRIGLSRGQIDYAYKVLSGQQILLDPKTHGFEELRPVAGN